MAKIAPRVLVRPIFAPIAGAVLLLSACATSTPFQPLAPGTRQSGGYSEQRIEENRYRVAFTGNSFTSRERVENFLLLRAAQLTLQNGYDGFTMITRQTDPKVETSVSRVPFAGAPFGYWSPSWRYRFGGLGWNSWDPWGGDPFWADNVDVQTVTSYEASAEIVMFRGAKPGDGASFDARQVVANLGALRGCPPDGRCKGRAAA